MSGNHQRGEANLEGGFVREVKPIPGHDDIHSRGKRASMDHLYEVFPVQVSGLCVTSAESGVR